VLWKFVTQAGCQTKLFFAADLQVWGMCASPQHIRTKLVRLATDDSSCMRQQPALSPWIARRKRPSSAVFFLNLQKFAFPLFGHDL